MNLSQMMKQRRAKLEITQHDKSVRRGEMSTACQNGENKQPSATKPFGGVNIDFSKKREENVQNLS